MRTLLLVDDDEDIVAAFRRLVLSGYTDLQSITDAIDEGVIYESLAKPWDDERLRAHLREAFVLKQGIDRNRRLAQVLRTESLECTEVPAPVASK